MSKTSKPDIEDLARPSVQVTVPKVTLTLADLAHLRSIGQPKSVRCHGGHKVIDRLRFLDLIARAKVSPSSEVAAEVKQEIAKHRTELTAAVKRSDWMQVSNLSYRLQQAQKRLDPTEDDVLTERGKALLKLGEVQVRVRKVGCAT